jgi:hypothetical protein
MPRKPIDYSKTIIYKLVCNDVEVTELYVGSTTNFRNRKNGHKSKCHNSNSSEHYFKVYQFIRNNGGFKNWSMIVIEKYPCDDKLEGKQRKRYFIEKLHATLNKQIPSRTKTQYCLDYKDYLLEQKRKSMFANVEILTHLQTNHNIVKLKNILTV